MTIKILDRLEAENPTVFKTIKKIKNRHNDERFKHSVIHGEARGYLVALRDLNIITESEFRVLFTYITL